MGCSRESSPGPGGARRIDGKAIAEAIHAEVEAEARRLREAGAEPHLVAVQAGADAASVVYVEKQRERFSKLGIRYTHVHLGAAPSLEEVEARLDGLNGDPAVTGIMVMLPLPPGIPVHRIEEQIAPAKDVEGVSPANLGLLVHGRHFVGPCTALAAMKAIEATGVPLSGLSAVVIGRSGIVGKPVGLLLLQAHATVTTCHTRTRDLAAVARTADLLVAAAGKPGLVTRDMVKPGAIVIDVGIHKVEGRTVGDVDFEDVAPVAGWITPVPGGVGPITVAMLARNTVACAQRSRGA
ncbi:MAG: bifunctional 5,10-methylenetetrahydrofolate dehydrogenase/5,10-methenyltetrahydrofolate cyclohydrolase [Planctomycetes bacterium]|nr:bifunctional 5,10-methylenetetrahydrofolate dehydrogenase/5,10-methenyltetrahydrofolate cyclohydrolase [Planctomycetota bacterium]